MGDLTRAAVLAVLENRAFLQGVGGGGGKGGHGQDLSLGVGLGLSRWI